MSICVGVQYVCAKYPHPFAVVVVLSSSIGDDGRYRFWQTYRAQGLMVFLGSKVVCAFFWNLQSLPHLPLSPLESKFQHGTFDPINKQLHPCITVLTDPCIAPDRWPYAWWFSPKVHLQTSVMLPANSTRFLAHPISIKIKIGPTNTFWMSIPEFGPKWNIGLKIGLNIYLKTRPMLHYNCQCHGPIGDTHIQSINSSLRAATSWWG